MYLASRRAAMHYSTSAVSNPSPLRRRGAWALAGCIRGAWASWSAVIAAELVSKVRQSVTIDWNLRESARAKIKVMVKKILRKHGYPPDLQEEAVKTVLMQAELLCADWV
jgi:hypothetical protein